MRRNPRDPEGYYQVLNISPGASVSEVKLAYTFLKNAWQKNRSLPRARIREAYDFLCDPECKSRYDTGHRRKTKIPVRMVGGLAVALVLLLFAGFVFPAFLVPAPEPFAAGDFLVSRHDYAPLGQVIRRGTHRFSNGREASAYLVRLEEGGESWFPVADLETHYRPRTGG